MGLSIFEAEVPMDCSFGESRQEHIRIVDGEQVFERWRSCTREPSVSEHMVQELNNAVDLIIQQPSQMSEWLSHSHADINRIVGAGNNFDHIQNSLQQVMQGHERKLGELNSQGRDLREEFQQFQQHVQQHFVGHTSFTSSLNAVEQLCTTSVSELERKLPTLIDNYLQTHVSIVHTLLKPYLESEHKSLDDSRGSFESSIDALN